MFSPMGKKKLLLQQKFGSSGHINTNSPISPTMITSSRSHTAQDTGQDSPTNEKVDLYSSVASSSNLKKALEDPGVLGKIMNTVLSSTSRYRPNRDTIVLKAFESKCIEYKQFRFNLHSAFWLKFDDAEFKVLCEYFDPPNSGLIDGYSFMIAFTRLSAIRKSRETHKILLEQEIYAKELKEEEERKKLEKEKKTELKIDLDFDPSVRSTALKKLNTAATKFDPGHPAAMSTDAFDVNFLRPDAFR